MESPLPLSVASCLACLASVSFTGLCSSSGFLCVETQEQDKGGRVEEVKKKMTEDIFSEAYLTARRHQIQVIKQVMQNNN